MVYRPSLAFALVLAVMPVETSSGQEQSAPQSVASMVSALASELVQRGECVGIAVAVDKGGERGFYGFGSIEQGTGQLPNVATEFEIGSITKVFTTSLLALYAHRHVIRLDDPLQKYVPPDVTVPTFSGRQITLVDLATHTSGLPRAPPFRGDSYSSNEMFAFRSTYHLTHAPGSRFEYSNLGVALLAHALQKATGVP